MKRIFIFIIIVITIMFIPKNTLANDSAKSAIVVDLNSGRILYEKNANEKRLIASTTKIMTAILTIENANLDDYVEVGDEIMKMYGTNIYLEIGEKISINDLLYGLILRSGNDSSVVLAKYIGGTEENFVKLMNEKAKKIGMTNTEFSNPHGLDDNTKNYSTALDMAILSKYAYQNKMYRKISSTKKYSTTTNKKTYLWHNRNKLLYRYDLCTGGKNGYTPNAGKTLVTTAKKNNLEVSAITLNDPNEYDNHQYLYDLVFNKYKNYTIVDKEKFKFPKTLIDEKNIYLKKSFTYPLTELEKKLIEIKIEIDNKRNINSEEIGKVLIILDKKIIGNISIYENKKEKANNFFFVKIKNYFLEILKKLKLGLQNSLNPGPLVPKPLEINNFDLSNS